MKTTKDRAEHSQLASLVDAMDESETEEANRFILEATDMAKASGRRKEAVKASIRCKPSPYTDPHTQDLHQDAAALEAVERSLRAAGAELARLRDGVMRLALKMNKAAGHRGMSHLNAWAGEFRALLDDEE